MKKLLLSGMLLISTQLFAQSSAKETVVDSKSKGFGGHMTTLTRFSGDAAVFTGTYGGWYVNKKLLVGVGAYGLVSTHESTNTNENREEQDYIRMGYGGLATEYTLHSGKLMRYTATSLLAYGRVYDGYNYSANDQWEKVQDEVFVTETSFNAELNVVKWFRVAAGVGYRSVMDSDMDNLSNKDMSALTGNVTFKFGWF